MVVSFLVIAMFVVTSALWFAGQIGDEAPEGSKWYIVAALCGLPFALWIQLTCRLVPKDQAKPGWEFVSTIATIVVVIVMVDQLQNGLSEALSQQNIIIGFWLIGLTVNFRPLVPIWASPVTLVWAVLTLVDGFLHALAAKDVWHWYDQTLFPISFLAALISIVAIGLAFRKAAAQE